MKNTKTLRYLLSTVSILFLTLLLSAPPSWATGRRGVVAAKGLVLGENDRPIWVEYDDEGEVAREIGEAHDDPYDPDDDGLENAVVISGDAYRSCVDAYLQIKAEYGSDCRVIYSEEYASTDLLDKPPLEKNTVSIVVGTDTPGGLESVLLQSILDLNRIQDIAEEIQAVLLSKEGEVVEESEVNIGYRVAFYTPKGDSGDPKDIWGEDVLTGYDPNEHDLWAPMEGVLVTANNGAGITGKDGTFSIEYSGICNATVTLMAQLRYSNFDPQWNSGSYYGTYYVWHKLYDSCSHLRTWSVHTNALLYNFNMPIGYGVDQTVHDFLCKFPVDIAMATGEAIMWGIPLVEEGEKTQYDDSLTENWLGLMDQGLLKQISRDDLKNTDIYIYRCSNNQLIMSRKGLGKHEWGAASSYGDINVDDGLINYRMVMRGPVDQMFYDRGWETFEEWQARTNVNEDLRGKKADHIRTGEQVKIIIINRASGYMGTSVGTVGESIQQGLLSFIPGFIVMVPPNVRIEAKRRYKVDLGLTAGKERKYTIGFEGSGLTSDELIVITTEWVHSDGSPLPDDLPGFTGRLAKVVQPDLLGPGPDGIAQFPIKPGLNTQLVELPRKDIDRCHYYLHVSGEPIERNPDFCTIGAGEGALEYRPRVYAPVQVPMFDEEATLAERQTDPEAEAQYQWVYRPEMQFSVFDLEPKAMSQTDPDGDEYNVLRLNKAGIGASDLSEGSNEKIYDEMQFVHILLEDDPELRSMLEAFGPERALVFSFAEQQIPAVFCEEEEDKLEIVPESITFEDLVPADILSIRLYQTSDTENILWEYDFKAVAVEHIILVNDKGRLTDVVEPGRLYAVGKVTNPPGRPVKWSLVKAQPAQLAKYITLNESTGALMLAEAAVEEVENLDDMRIAVRATDLEVPTAFREGWLDCGCPKCKGDSCPPGSGGGKEGSVDVRVRLGKAEHGGSAGSLFLWAERPSPELASPQGLALSSLAREVELVYSDGTVRQVLAPETLVDIVVTDAFSYDLRFFRPEDITGQNEGRYELDPSVAPFVIWRVENLDASETMCNCLTVSELRDGKVGAYEYVWDEAQNALSLSHPEGLKLEKRAETVDVSGDRLVTRTVEDGSETVASMVQYVYHAYPWGESIVESIEDPEGAALTTTRTHYEDPGVTGSYGKVESRISPDGSWVRYHYDQRGRTITRVHGWLDEPSTALSADVRTIHYDYDPVDPSDAELSVHEQQPRTATERVQGTVVAKTYYAYLINASDEQIEIEERCADPQAAYGAAGNLRTVRTYYVSGTDLPESGRIKSVLYPDGRLDTDTYEKGAFTSNADPAQSQFAAGTGSHVRETVVHGTAEYPEGIANKTTKETSIEDKLGRELMAETYVYTGSGYERVKWTAYTYDAFGHVVAVQQSDGTRTDSTWGCCGKESDTDAQGITTSYTLDALQRVEAETRDGLNNDIVTTYTYDGAGRQLTQTVTAEDLIQATQSVYDLAGRLDTSTDPAGLVTSYDYTQGGLVSTVTRPGGATEVTTRYLDGRVKSVTGTGVVARYYEYGVNVDGARWTKVYTGAEDSPMWEKTTTDALGRTIKVERPGFAGVETTENFYNDAGRLIKTTTSGLADTLYVYDELGNQVQNGLDVDDNGVLETASNDRINESEASYTLVNSNWWQETAQRVYATSGDATATTASTQRAQVSGLGVSGKTQETVAIDVNGNETVSQVFIDRLNDTMTRVVDYPDSSTNGITTTISGLVTSTQSKTGVTVTYSYDPLERRTGATDPRAGTNVTHYNDEGQVDYVEDAAGNRTEYTYDLQTGRKAVETNALAKSVRFGYNNQGQVTHTWGDATYPVEYVYDDYGRMKEMHTYRGGATWNGETWPTDTGGADVTTWHYHEATGLLTQKEDASGHSVYYSYDTGGKLATRTWGRTESGSPVVTSYSYDPDTGELLNIDYSDSTPDITFTYDRLGRQKTVSDAIGSRAFAYNDSLQLATETMSGLISETITRSYETTGVPGRSSGFSLASDYSVTYGYDTTGRFNSVAWNVDGVQDTATYSYVPDSDLLYQLSTVNGQQSTYTYEPHRNLRTQVENAYNASVISNYQYEYDALGRRSSVANSGEAFSAVNDAFNLYGYNDRNELTESTRYLGADTSDISNPVGSEYRGYTYDPIGNRTEAVKAAATSSYTANSLNQYTQQTIAGETGSTNFTYDVDGNLTSVYTVDSSITYTYNAENRLIVVEPETPAEGDTKVEFTYDYMGRRIQKKVYTYQSGSWLLTSDSLFLYDGWNLAKETTDAGTTGTVYYVNGLDLSSSLQGAGGIGGLIARIGAANTHLYTYDVNGNVGQLVNAADGTIVGHYEYDPYGNAIVADGAEAQSNPYRFSTKYTDDETGLVYYGYRYYSPQLGRWLSRDPIEEEGGANIYLFAGNDGISHFDVLGLWWGGTHKRLTWGSLLDVKHLPQGMYDFIGGSNRRILDEVLEILQEENVAVDSGDKEGVMAWHFNRDLVVGETEEFAEIRIKVAKLEYLILLAQHAKDFYAFLSEREPTHHFCQEALKRLGWLSHAWQDYYAHAIRKDSYVDYSSRNLHVMKVWGGADPGEIEGDPDHIGPNIKPSTWQGPRNTGEHGAREPGNRAPDQQRRLRLAREFVATKYSVYLKDWWETCHCVWPQGLTE